MSDNLVHQLYFADTLSRTFLSSSFLVRISLLCHLKKNGHATNGGAGVGGGGGGEKKKKKERKPDSNMDTG